MTSPSYQGRGIRYSLNSLPRVAEPYREAVRISLFHYCLIESSLRYINVEIKVKIFKTKVLTKVIIVNIIIIDFETTTKMLK